MENFQLASKVDSEKGDETIIESVQKTLHSPTDYFKRLKFIFNKYIYFVKKIFNPIE